MIIRRAAKGDEDGIWAILAPVIRSGTTYALPQDLSRDDALTYWMEGHSCFIAEADGILLGTYYLRANQQGGGGHVCNCGYITAEAARRRGVARAMCVHSQEEALAQGFKAMQFNLVISTNTPAVELWKTLGFAVVGTLPNAFKHPDLGYVDAFVMYKTL